VVPVTFVLTGALFSQAAAAGTLDASYHGLVQRVTIALGFGWLSVIAILLLREQQPAGDVAANAQPPESRPASVTQFYEPSSAGRRRGGRGAPRPRTR
jgi:hypothetical protein